MTTGGPLGALPRTTAKYAGQCARCGEDVVVGDALVKLPDEEIWVHEGCDG